MAHVQRVKVRRRGEERVLRVALLGLVRVLVVVVEVAAELGVVVVGEPGGRAGDVRDLGEDEGPVVEGVGVVVERGAVVIEGVTGECAPGGGGGRGGGVLVRVVEGHHGGLGQRAVAGGGARLKKANGSRASDLSRQMRSRAPSISLL